MKITVPEMTITIPNPAAILACWKWGLLALLVLAVTVTWGYSASQTTVANEGDVEMSLNVKANGACDDPAKPTKCSVPVASEFTLSVSVNGFPIGGYTGFQTEIDYDGLTYKKAASAADEIVWPDAMPLSLRQQDVPNNIVNHADATHIIPPFPPSFYKGNVVEIALNCTAVPGTHVVDLAPYTPGNTSGTALQDTFGGINPASDSLVVNCVILHSGINITKQSVVVPLPGACFQVNDEDNTEVFFTVCDNDVQGPESDPRCEVDGTPECEDIDPAPGSIWVSVASGQYSVNESQAPVNHNLATGKQPCDNKLGKCELTFENTSKTMPWHPWDITGEGQVRVDDILAVVNNYFNDKPPGP